MIEDHELKARDALAALRREGLTMAAAESCTGGLVCAALTDIPGSSDVVDRGFVTYTNAAKAEMLGVPPELISEHGAVSEPVAKAMAEGALAHSQADLAVAITGIAGPGGSDAKPEGRVCFAAARRGRETRVETHDFGPLGRTRVRAASVDRALELLIGASRPAPEG